MTPELIIFDKDGTLFDVQATWGKFTGDLLDELAGDDADRHAALSDAVGYLPDSGRLANDSIVVAGTTEEVARAALPYLANPMTLSSLANKINTAAETAPIEPAVALAPLFELLQSRGLRLAVATNDAEAPARAHLNLSSVTDYFDHIVGYDSGYGAKPAPGQLQAIAELSGIHPAACVMVGDSLHDLLAGRAAGMRTVGVLTGTATHEALSPLADIVMNDIGGLPEWLDTL